jgi:hypothetical protein
VGKFILTNVRLWAGGADLTSHSNKVELSSEVEAKDATNYGSGGWKEQLGGLASSTLKGAGQWEAGDPGLIDNHAWGQLGAVGAWTVSPHAGAVGDVAYLLRALESSYTLLGDVGEIAPWAADAMGSWPMPRGQVAHPSGTARTASGTGTGLQLGAVAAGDRMYASLHVLSVAGTSTPTITGRVESDDNSGFTSATTRLTFTAATAKTGEILRTDGSAITDDWWRVAWTITGTTPSFLFAAALGIT